LVVRLLRHGPPRSNPGSCQPRNRRSGAIELGGQAYIDVGDLARRPACWRHQKARLVCTKGDGLLCLDAWAVNLAAIRFDAARQIDSDHQPVGWDLGNQVFDVAGEAATPLLTDDAIQNQVTAVKQ